MEVGFDLFLNEIRNCRKCVEAPLKTPLPHEPRPVLQVSQKAKIAICGQAPGTKVHLSGRPFTDRSGDRLRAWLGVTEEVFYDSEAFCIIPMGFCFPGQNEKGADLPPRPECKALWHDGLFKALSGLELILMVGKYAQAYHLKRHPELHEFYNMPLYQQIEAHQYFINVGSSPLYLPLPHPSWRNNSWIKNNSWFEEQYLPIVRDEILKILR